MQQFINFSSAHFSPISSIKTCKISQKGPLGKKSLAFLANRVLGFQGALDRQKKFKKKSSINQKKKLKKLFDEPSKKRRICQIFVLAKANLYFKSFKVMQMQLMIERRKKMNERKKRSRVRQQMETYDVRVMCIK